MNELTLKRQKHNERNFDGFLNMRPDLENFFNEDVDFNDETWNKNLNAVLDFQDDDGSFKFYDSYRIPSDAVVDYCFMPTYICTAILMKAYITDSQRFTSKAEKGLLRGLKMSCTRKLWGHGFEGFKGQIEALNIFMKAGLREFMDLHQEFCPEFSEMINEIVFKFQEMESQGKFFGPWGESYEDEIRAVNEYFSQRKVFVYGTLMSGETNHYYLQNSTFLGKTTIEGYDMYDCGWYPAITAGDGLIIGEVYRVPKVDMPSIDMLEGEGSLYIKRCETVTDGKGNNTFAFVFVYLGDCSELKKIPSWKEHIWYVSYGSNMLMERFMCYIKGGSFEGSAPRKPCRDKSPPAAVKTVEIPYEMYFGKESSWGGGVSFLDTGKEGKSLGVAYLITEEQFRHVAAEENGGRRPGGGEWYEDFIDLGMMDGFEVKTVTNNNLRDYNDPCEKYLNTLRRGIRQNWPDMSDEEIDDYLYNCIR